MKIFADYRKTIPFLYTLMGLLLFAVHFFQFEEFAEKVNGFHISGRKSVASELFPSQIRHFGIEVPDLGFYFRPFRQATLITVDRIRHPINFLGWKAVEDGIHLEFTYNVYLLIQRNGKNLQLRPVIPETILPEVDSLELPLAKRSRGSLKISEKFSWQAVARGEGKDFTVSLPQADPEKGNLHFHLNKTSLIIGRISENNAMAVYHWLNLYQGGTEKEKAASVLAWLDRLGNEWLSKAALSGDFFLETGNTTGNSQSPPGIFSPRIAAIILGHSLEAGNFPAVLENVRAAQQKSVVAESWIMGPWLGNIISLGLLYRDRLSDYASQLLVYSAGNSPLSNINLPESLTMEWPLGPSAREILTDTGNDIMNARLMQRVEDYLIGKEAVQEKPNGAGREQKPEVVIAGVTGPSTADLIRSFGLLSGWRTNGQEDLYWLLPYVENYLVPRIIWEADGLWLVEENKLVYPEQNIKAGLMLEALAGENENLQKIGRQLVISALNLGKGNNSIPQSFVLNNNAVLEREGVTEPQTIYSLLTNGIFIPRHLSLYEELGEQYWIITGAGNFTAERTNGGIKFEMDFPPGYEHYIVAGNIESVSGIKIHNITLRPDRNFQQYHAGWYHEPDKRLLFIKIQHRNRRETIRIIP